MKALPVACQVGVVWKIYKFLEKFIVKWGPEICDIRNGRIKIKVRDK